MTTAYDDLAVSVHEDAATLGTAVARQFADEVRGHLARRASVGVILQTGNSQLPFVEALAAIDELEWSRVEVFHLDEYLGISEDHPASFARWIREHIVDRFAPKAFHALDGAAPDPPAEAQRYGALLRERAPQVCVMGIGENGQLAFNDPPAEFHTLDPMLLVELAESSQHPEVPSRLALSMSITGLLSTPRVLVCVPERRKAEAVQAALEGPVRRGMPASILRTCPRAHLHVDREAASALASMTAG